jgi:hypothetical protein
MAHLIGLKVSVVTLKWGSVKSLYRCAFVRLVKTDRRSSVAVRRGGVPLPAVAIMMIVTAGKPDSTGASHQPDS